MKILLPVRFKPGAWLGGSNYFLSLVSALRQRPADDVEIVVASNRPEGFGQADAGGVRIVHAPWLEPRSRADHFANGLVDLATAINPRLYWLANRIGADLVSHVVPGRMPPCPMLYWMPDFQHRHYPDFFSARERRARDRDIAASARTGHLLVSSRAAEADFRRFYPELANVRVHVMNFTPGLDDADAPPAASLLAHYGLREDFFFLPNQFWRHKNHAVVIEALRQLPPTFQVACTGAIVDYRGDEHIRSMMQAIRSHGLEQRFLLLGVLPRAEMMGLMSACRAVINPSLFEGWSTTVEEAKNSGKRLLLSDIPVHREQDPADALYFAAHDAGQLAAAMQRIRDEYDPASEKLRAASAIAMHPRRVERFSARYLEIARAIAPARGS